MSVARRINPAPALSVPGGDPPPVALLDTTPAIVLGNDREPPLVPRPVPPDAASCFGPRGALLAARGGPLLVCDTGHHRLLGWNRLPATDRAPADWQIGQPGFGREGRNGRGAVGSATLNVPTGICAVGEGLAVADAWNHRVLIWHRVPACDNVPADIVLGQVGFGDGDANRGRAFAAADTLNWPYGVHYDGARLFVADTGNRRVLAWNTLPAENGCPADRVLGQRDFAARDENAGGEPDASSMRWPHAVTTWRGRPCVADAGNNRVMIWHALPTVDGAPCDIVIGQDGERTVDHNRALYWPRANALNMPYGIAAAGDWLLVADTANSRILGWHADDLAIGASARALFGQPSFADKGDNRWRAAVADSLCWPYGIAARGDLVTIADSGNNRVGVFGLHP